MVVKNSLARRATEGTQLGRRPSRVPTGQVGVCWGSTDFVSLVKEVVRLDKDEEKYETFVADGGVMDGEKLDADGLKAVSKWPSREEQISLLVGQILGPGCDSSPPRCSDPARCSTAKSNKKAKATSSRLRATTHS